MHTQVRLKDYIAKKEGGTLKMDKFQIRMNTALQKVRAPTAQFLQNSVLGCSSCKSRSQLSFIVTQ
jgi:hypothetical protein